jgi:mitochondrial fission protein ELM1
VELLTEARRLPEVVYVLKAEESKWLERNLNRKQIEKELEEEIAKIRDEKQQKIEEARRAAQEAGEEFNPPPEEEEELPKL